MSGYVDQILKGFAEEETPVKLPDDLPCNENIRLPSLTERGLKESNSYHPDNKKYRLLRVIRELNTKVEKGIISETEAIKELKLEAGPSEKSKHHSYQKIEELIKEGCCKGEEPWYLKFDIQHNDYKRLCEMSQGSYTTLSSLSTLWHEPEEKLRRIGRELDKRGLLLFCPGTVDETFYTFTKSGGRYDFRWIPIKRRLVTFLDKNGNETKEAFLNTDWKERNKDREIERANQNYMDRAILKTLQHIERGEIKIGLEKKKGKTREKALKPIIGEIIRPFADKKMYWNRKISDKSPGSPTTVEIMLDYFPSLQACRVIDFDYEASKKCFGKKKFEDINKKRWSKHGFDLLKKRIKFLGEMTEGFISDLKSNIERAQQYYPNYRPPLIEESKENIDKVSYLQFIASGFKRTRSFSPLERIGMFKLTNRGEDALNGVYPVVPYLEITELKDSALK